MIERAITSIAKGHHCDAIANLGPAVEACPEWAPGRAHLGLAYLRIAQFEAAQRECETATLMAPPFMAHFPTV